MRMIGNEYRTTMVCIDSYKNRVLAGRLYNPFCPEGKRFESLIEYLLVMESLLDQMKFPQPFNDRRTFSDAMAFSVGKAEYLSFDSGHYATFRVRILFRQNASWQGSVYWVEGNTEETFRSVLELALLMDSALSRSCECVPVVHLEEDNCLEEPIPDSPLTRDEYRHILQTAKRKGQKRAYMIIKTVVGVGARQEELQQLSVEALKEGSTWVMKHGHKRLLEIPEPLRSELLAYAEEEGIQTGQIFVTKNGVPMSHPHIWKEIKRVCREAGIAEEKAGPSSLYKLYRATYLSMCSMCSSDTEQLKERIQRLLEREEQYVAWDSK